MSKEKHTPKYECRQVAANSICIHKGNGIQMHIDTENDIDEVHIEYANRVVRCLNNHDRLVEALEKLKTAVGKWEASDNETIEAFHTARQLLTELKA